MVISTKAYKQTGCITINGNLDSHAQIEFKRTYVDMLNNPAIHEIELEMQHLDFLDNAALGMLMLLRERAQAVNKSIVLSNPSRRIAKQLEVANFDKMFSIKRPPPLPENTLCWAIEFA